MGAFKPSTIAAALAAITFGFSASADDKHDKQDKFRAKLSGYNEVHFNGGNPANNVPATLIGAISTPAKGSFRAEIDDRAQVIDYELSYEGLEGNVTQAHIHFGQRHTVGGIVVWLCETDAAQHPIVALRRPVTPECPGPNAGTVTGTIQLNKVLTLAGQGFEGPDLFNELVRAIRAGATYTNVHSSRFGPGEIRGHNVQRGHHDH